MCISSFKYYIFILMTVTQACSSLKLEFSTLAMHLKPSEPFAKPFTLLPGPNSCDSVWLDQVGGGVKCLYNSRVLSG